MSDSDDRAGADAGADAEAGRGGAEFLEQARWLLEWHNQRGEAITTRATAVLGFGGVVLALLLQGAGIKDFEPRWWTWVALATGLLCLLISGVCALMVVLPRDTQMPSVGQLRAWWAAQMADASRGATSAQIAESILIGGGLGQGLAHLGCSRRSRPPRMVVQAVRRRAARRTRTADGDGRRRTSSRREVEHERDHTRAG